MVKVNRESAVLDRLIARVVPKVVAGAAGLAFSLGVSSYFLLTAVDSNQRAADVERAAVLRRIDALSGRFTEFAKPGDRFTAHDGKRHERALDRLSTSLSEHERRLDRIEQMMIEAHK